MIAQHASGVARIARLSYLGCALAVEAACRTAGDIDEIIITSTPPFAFMLYALLRRGRRWLDHLCRRPSKSPIFRLWLMDLNREQLSRSENYLSRLVAYLLLPFERLALREATETITLDHHMQQTLISSHARIAPITIEPLGPLATPPRRGHSDNLKPRPFTVMHGGNLSMLHDLTTMMTAASLLKKEPINFVFTRFGRALPLVESWIRREHLSSFQLVPPRPNEERDSFLLQGSLHIVVVGNKSIGVCHPSKVYNLIALKLPILYIGPRRGAIYELLLNYPFATIHQHGDAVGVAQTIRNAAAKGAVNSCSSWEHAVA